MKKSLQGNQKVPTGKSVTSYRRIAYPLQENLRLPQQCFPGAHAHMRTGYGYGFLPFFLSLYRGVGVWFLFLEKLMQIDCGMLDDVLEFFSERLEHTSLIHCERSRLCTR